MKTVLLFACAILMMSCQKEVLFPQQVKEGPHEVVITEPAAPEPQPAEEPQPEPESQNVYLSDLPNHFNSQHHFHLINVYTDDADLWEGTPAWLKDDVHTMNDLGDGSIESISACPDNPFTSISQNWTAYADDDGVRLTWVDLQYQPVTFTFKSINVGRSFTVFYSRDGVRTYLQFAVQTDQ